jgi:hypothetical protein
MPQKKEHTVTLVQELIGLEEFFFFQKKKQKALFRFAEGH